MRANDSVLCLQVYGAQGKVNASRLIEVNKFGEKPHKHIFLAGAVWSRVAARVHYGVFLVTGKHTDILK